MATLGISTNTRLLGLAIISENELVEHAVHLYKSPWSARKANKIVTSLEPCVRRYSITKVVLSTPHVYHQTKAYSRLEASIKIFFKERSIPINSFTAKDLKSFVASNDRRVKKTLMKEICARFPQLRYCHERELRNKNKYYIKVFEAVAAALSH